MNTGKLLVTVFALLAVLSLVAYLWRPKEDFQGKTPLVWVSDKNPARPAQIEAFNRENPDLHLSLDSMNTGMQRVIQQCSSGVGPDLFDFGGDDQQAYVEAGILWDLTETADKMGFSVHKQGWQPGADTGLCFGRQYGYYCNIGTRILIYNKNIFDYFGVSYPKELMTWDEFLAMARKVTSFHLGENTHIYAVIGTSWNDHFASVRGEFFTEEGLLDIRSAKLRKAFQWHKDLLFKYRLMATSLELKALSGQGGWGSGSVNLFAAGRFAMIVDGDYSLIALGQAYKYQMEQRQAGSPSGASEQLKNPLERPLRLGAAMVPHASGIDPNYRISTRMAGINLRSARRVEALKVLQFFSGPAYSALINKGMDWLPGNPAYADLGVEDKYPDLSRVQMHEMTKKEMSYGYVFCRSPFILTSDVERVLRDQVKRMESDPRLEVDDLLAAAEAELMVLIRRNLDHRPELKKLYNERVAEARKAADT